MGGITERVIQALLLALFAISSASAHAAVFNDGNDRRFIKDLRAKDPAGLTDEEKAILAAANKVGVIGLCKGKNTGNAFLILYRGRPAVVTSAHAAFDPKNGRLMCSSDAELVKGMAYMPNTGFYDSADPSQNRDFIFRQIGLEFPPANWAEVKGRPFRPEEDFLVFYLQEDITRDRMPDGSTRGYLEFSETVPGNSSLFMIGFTGDMGGGMEMVYQSRCDGFIRGRRFYHGCDSRNGSSAALIGTLGDGEIRLRAVHNAGDEISNLPASAKSDPMKANIATSSAAIAALMKREVSRPNFLASDIQAILSRAGCYSGKLDNEWGPASRHALAAFTAAVGVTLPGTEPSAELLAAVETAATAGREVCSR